MMKIAINGKSFGVKEQGGAVRVAFNVVKYLAAIAPDFQLELFIPIDFRPSASFDFPENVCIHWSVSKIYGFATGKMWWEQMVLPSLIQQHQINIVLNLTNSAPVLRSLNGPQILLLHDTGFLNKEWFSYSYSFYVTWVVRLALKQQAHLVTVSQTTAEDISDSFPTAQSVTAIHNGVDTKPVIPADYPSLGFPYLLFLGSLNPRKNIQGVIEGFKLYKKQYNGNLRLVIAGSQKKIFANWMQDDSNDSDIIFEGYVYGLHKWNLLKNAKS